MLRRQPSDTSTEVKTLRCINYDDEQASTTQSNDIINANVALASGKEENFTGRGSKDSGIVCDLQTERRQTGRLRDSIDSNEIDLGEECVESFAATSMDEEYAKLRADLEFCAVSDDAKQAMQATSHRSHPPPSDDDIERLCREQRNASSPLDDLPAHRSNHTICVARDTDATANSAETTPTNADATMTTAMGLSSATNTNVTPTECSGGEPSKSDHNKNDVIFKNIFGATKNAIFRTAQSIIENHEKKHAQKMQNNSCSGSGGSGNSGSTNNSKSDVDAGRSAAAKSPIELVHKKDFFTLKAHSSKQKTTSVSSDDTSTPQPDSEMAKHIPRSMTALTFTAKDKERKVPGMVKCFVRSCKETDVPTTISLPKIENGHNGLLRFFESPIFNIHFAIHYLFYSKEPGVLSFIGNKIFSFKDHDVDLYIPQLILMYIQMDDLAEVLDPYLVHRCRKAADFSLKCSWLLEAYNYTADSFSLRSSYKKPHLMLIRELYPKRDRRALHRQQLHLHDDTLPRDAQSPVKKTHHRSQSDATGLLNAPFTLTTTMKLFQTPVRLCLGDLSTGRAFDNGCSCFESVRGTVNDLLGHKTVCTCGASKLAAQREFMKSLVDIGRDLTPLPSKTEKTSILRMRLNLINKNLPARVWLPLNSDMPHHIVRIKEEKTAVLNSKDKTPYIIYVEVVEVNDIYTSPVIAKMMPSLRHTKSEEHLDSSSDVAAESSDVIKYNAYWQEQHNGISDDNAWLPEDDEITAQYLNMHKSVVDRDTISEMSLDSVDSRDHSGTGPVVFNIGDVRTRHTYNLRNECTKPFFDPKDPSAAALKEPWHEKERQIRESSPYGHLSNWRLLSAIVKCGDDLRQELMATQLLEVFKLIWEEEHIDLWVRPYKIVCFSNDSGLIEPILNTVSLHQIKKNSNKSLREYFVDEYGSPETENFKTAQKNFMHSCAAYCLISYLLQVKDRHNGNILLHSDGHLIHIDFGFILSISPKNLGFEQSPFKLTPEFVDVMGGPESELWSDFQYLLLKGLMAARKHMDRVINIVEIMRSSAQLPCFKNGCAGTIRNLRYRFHMNLTEEELERKLDQLVQDSLNSLSTKLYDGYQYLTNGIL